MAQVCRVCSHAKTKEIEQDIVQGLPHTQIGEKYGIHFQSVRYHSEHHLPEKLVKTVRDKKSNHAENILDGIRDLLTRTKTILENAEEDGHNRLALEAIKEARSTYELLSKIAVKLEEYRRKDEEREDYGIEEQIQDGLQALTTAELKTYIALQAKIYSAQPDYELDPGARYMVESVSEMWDQPRGRISDSRNGTRGEEPSQDSDSQDKNTIKDRVSTPQSETDDELDDFDLEFDDLDDFSLSNEIPSDDTDPKWLAKWRKENPPY